MEKDLPCKQNNKHHIAGVAILISDKMGLNAQSISRQKATLLHNKRSIPLEIHNSQKFVCA